MIKNGPITLIVDPGTVVDCGGYRYTIVSGPDNFGLYAMHGTDPREIFHAKSEDFIVVSVPAKRK